MRPDLAIPDTLANLVMRCLEKNRDLRPAHAGEVIREIERAEQEIQRPAKSGASVDIQARTSDRATPSGGVAVLKRQDSDRVDSALWSEGNVIAGKYRLLAKLFEDGFCVAFKALQVNPGLFRTLVVVRRDEYFSDWHLAQFGKVFKEDALNWLKLRHPNVVRVEEVSEDDDCGRPFMVMESIGGGSLEEVIRQQAPFAPLRACAIAKQIASGLEAAHAQGGVYGEVAPKNLWVFPDSEGEKIKLLPLRRQKLQDALEAVEDMPSLHLDFRFVSPEQIKGLPTNQLDCRVDLYSLGVVIYQMLVGELPFPGKTTVEIVEAVILKPPQPIRFARPDLAIPDSLANLVMRCLEKDPALRPANASEVIRELERAEEEIRRPAAPDPSTWSVIPVPPPAVTPPSPVPKPAPKPGPKPSLVARWSRGKRFWITLAVTTLAPILVGPMVESTRFSAHEGLLGYVVGVLGGLGWFLVLQDNWLVRALAILFLLNFTVFVGRRSVEIGRDFSWMRVIDASTTSNVYPIDVLKQADRCPVEVAGSRWPKNGEGGHSTFLVAIRNITRNARVTDWKADTLTFDDKGNLINDSSFQNRTPIALEPGHTTSVQLTGAQIEAADNAKLVFKDVDYEFKNASGATETGTWTNPHFQEDLQKAKQR